MLRPIGYKIKWVWIKGIPKKLVTPTYEDLGKGAGLENIGRIKRDEFGDPVYKKT